MGGIIVSNECGFRGSAKYFNGEEWVRLEDYKSGDSVLQYYTNGIGELVKPIEFRVYDDDETMLQYPVAGSNGMLTKNHRLVYRENFSSPDIRETKLCRVKKDYEYWLPATCNWDKGSDYVNLSEIGENLLCCSKPLSKGFITRVLSLSMKDRLLFLSKSFSGDMYYSDNKDKLKFVSDLLTLSNEAHYMKPNKNELGFVKWSSLGRTESGVGYVKLFKPEFRWRDISTKKYEMFNEVIHGVKRKYLITVPTGMIMLKFGIHNVVVGDSRR